ncbi:hypothetical protein GGI25_004984 [Coemansia spiralis]|uniref:Uncharacterized protein n=1 Tax=Coemansia spiralis TaxID=417178 RepID=A0A9W8FZG5_9FUNG|nr:hypothetical protein GGI26_005292 [Coemansia sp. RSA 1358]KAJ2672789.1 hypothetical protein GGI25_004984 [Coemansia spiralis]
MRAITNVYDKLADIIQETPTFDNVVAPIAYFDDLHKADVNVATFLQFVSPKSSIRKASYMAQVRLSVSAN